jgi:hypothetical protein
LHVVETGGVLKQVDDAHGIRGLPAIFDGDFRRNILQARFEIYFSIFLQLQERKRDKGFADRAYAKFRIASDIAAGRNVRFPESAAPEQLAIRDESDTRARQVSLVDNLFHRLLQIRKRFRVGQSFFLLGACEWG